MPVPSTKRRTNKRLLTWLFMPNSWFCLSASRSLCKHLSHSTKLKWVLLLLQSLNKSGSVISGSSTYLYIHIYTAIRPWNTIYVDMLICAHSQALATANYYCTTVLVLLDQVDIELICMFEANFGRKTVSFFFVLVAESIGQNICGQSFYSHNRFLARCQSHCVNFVWPGI